MILDKFVQEQKSRSSEYRFLSDEDDRHLSTFENLQLESTFDYDETSKSRFRQVEDNRFQIATFLAKMSRRLVEKGSNYNNLEINKVFDYFQGSRIIEYYQFWERILTLFILANEMGFYSDFVSRTEEQINKKMECDNTIMYKQQINQVKKTLHSHLKESILMSGTYHLSELAKITRSGLITCCKTDIYLISHMSRNHYNVLPLQQFMLGYSNKGVAMCIDDYQVEPKILQSEPSTEYWIPFRIKLYEIILAKTLTTDKGDVEDYSWLLSKYKQLNAIKNNDISVPLIHKGESTSIQEFEINDAKIFENYKIRENCTANKKDDIIVSLVQLTVSNSILEDILHKKQRKEELTELMLQVLDKVKAIKDTDIFVMPELSLPNQNLLTFCYQSARNEIAFVAGLEYRIRNNVVYNQLVNCIPISIWGEKDAIPFIRTKNHYAPIEDQEIEHHRLSKPTVLPPKLALFHFRGHIFASYYCYELANVRERVHFFSKVDAIYSPVFNPDTHYYNNIIQSTVRDMHCFFIQANVAKYGWSQIAQPTKHDYMQPLFVKGGVTSTNKVVVLSGKLPIAKLRQHQQLSLFGQMAKKDIFKCIPPAYDQEIVQKRVDDENLII